MAVDRIVPVAMEFAIIGPNSCAVTPDSKPPSSFDVPMNRLFTAETRPRFSSGVRICSYVFRGQDLHPWLPHDDADVVHRAAQHHQPEGDPEPRGIRQRNEPAETCLI